MCSDKESKEHLDKELQTQEEQGVDKDLMEGRYLIGINGQTEKWDGMEKESETKGCTVNGQISGKGV